MIMKMPIVQLVKTSKSESSVMPHKTPPLQKIRRHAQVSSCIIVFIRIISLFIWLEILLAGYTINYCKFQLSIVPKDITSFKEGATTLKIHERKHGTTRAEIATYKKLEICSSIWLVFMIPKNKNLLQAC